MNSKMTCNALSVISSLSFIFNSQSYLWIKIALFHHPITSFLIPRIFSLSLLYSHVFFPFNFLYRVNLDQITSFFFFEFLRVFLLILPTTFLTDSSYNFLTDSSYNFLTDSYILTIFLTDSYNFSYNSSY